MTKPKDCMLEEHPWWLCTLFRVINFISNDNTLTAQCSSMPSQATAFRLLRQAFYASSSSMLHNHRAQRMDRGYWQVASAPLCCSLYYWAPGLCVWNLFTLTQQCYWLFGVDVQEKALCFQYHCNWGKEDSCCPEMAELHPGPSNEIGHGTD